ncbi:N-acetylmuramoyl-L-alanine amidase [uncultured Alistipes sp.]|uniref:N-acetylmuramoyl-L-alanine amidase family protein n=1 Tax=uncultured Alistipes sp. TaxID=538949 RepID=UPI00266E9E33|nr:N-acetylmuramoyl-L-alanine amidase [uncultured Alistipes sp.]
MRARYFTILLAAAAAFLIEAATAQNTPCGIRVVVIDPGHGGDDPGAHYFGTDEKTLTLTVALKLGQLIEEGMPGVKVVYTRTTDKALAPTKIEDLQARADIANRAGGDLFVSIHVNAAKEAAARGVETLVMGESTKEQRYNEDALYENNRDDLIDMSDERTAAIVRAYIQNLQFTYGEYSLAMARFIQSNYVKTGRRSRGVKPQLLRVLYATDMPGVLTEIGFLSNPKEAVYLKSEAGQDEIARSLFVSVKNYSDYVLETRRRAEEEAAQAPPKPAPKPEPAPAPSDDAAAKPEKKTGAHFAIQILSSKKTVASDSPEFKNYRGKVREYTADGEFRYKYCVCECDTKAEAQQRIEEVRKTFPGAFIVRCKGDKIAK